MRHTIGGLTILVLVGICSLVHSAVLFEDNFDTKDNWVVATGTPTETVANGWYTVQSGAGLTFLRHDATYSTFTYTVKMKVESANSQGCGVLFCLQNNLASYMLYIAANKTYGIGRWEVSGSSVSLVPIYADWNSYITDADNVLQVSKSGSEISFFINGYFVKKITDSNIAEGAIGLYVGAGEKASFDYSCVTDDLKEEVATTWFSDDFEDNNLDGWRMMKGDGTYKAENGVLKIAPIDSTFILYTNGSFKDMPCTTTITYKSGNTSSRYGIMFLDFKPGQAIKAYCYFINANRKYAVFSMGNSFILQANSNINGTTDTFIITRDYEFIVNGTVLDDSTFTQGMDFNAVGLYVDAGLSVEVDNFSAGVYDTNVSVKYNPYEGIYTHAKPSYILGGSGIIYDTRGRRVATFENGYKDKLRNLSSGPYLIVIPNGGKSHVIHRAVINNR